MLALEDHGHGRPERPGHRRALVGERRLLDQDAVITQRKAELERAGDPGVAAPVVGEVVDRDDQCPLEVLPGELDMAPGRLGGVVALRAPERLALAPDPEGAHVHEGHVRVSVVAGRGGGQKAVDLAEEDGVVEVGLPGEARRIGHDALAGLEAVALRPRRLHPERRADAGIAFGRGEPQGDLLSSRDPPLRGRVHDRPVEAALLRLDVRPGEAEVDGREAGEVVERVGGCEPRPVLHERVVVVVQDEAHAGVHECAAVVGGANDHAARLGLGRERHPDEAGSDERERDGREGGDEERAEPGHGPE